MTTRIISGFCAIGKSHFQSLYPEVVVDLDHSGFHKPHLTAEPHHLSKTYLDTPAYLDHIEALIAQGKIVLVSTHRDVLIGLADRGLEHLLAFPETSCRQEYVDRIRARLSPEKLATAVGSNWYDWLDDLLRYPRASPLILGPGMFLSDVVAVENGKLKLKD